MELDRETLLEMRRGHLTIVRAIEKCLERQAPRVDTSKKTPEYAGDQKH